MRIPFYDIICSHSAAYPKMKGEDYVCLAYESEFGHGVSDFISEYSGLKNELESISADELEPMTVDIGGNYSRLNLAPVKKYLSADIIMSLMKMTKIDGTQIGYEKKLRLLKRSAEMGIIPLSDIASADPSAHTHSAIYKRLYGASYRVISKDLAPLIPGLCLISEALSKAGYARIGIDGMTASGMEDAKRVISKLYEGYDVKITQGLYTFKSDEEFNVKLFFVTDEDTQIIRLLDRGGQTEIDRYNREIKNKETSYFNDEAPHLQADIIIMT